MINLKLHSDSSEIIPYNFDDFHIHARKDLLSNYLNNSAPIHWHDDLEFIIVLEGQMYYTVNGQDYLIKKGDCIFINSRQLHGHHPADKFDCSFLCIIIPLEFYLANDYIGYKYIKNFCYNSMYSYILFNNSLSYYDNLIFELKSLYDTCDNHNTAFELDAISHMYKILSIIITNLDLKNDIILKPHPFIENLQQMIGFVQAHYADKISLDDIASSGNVCRSKCFDIFKELMHQTPNDYLISYRLNKSMELLKSSSLSVTDIALRCGFGSSSYFTKTFRMCVGVTPKEYRNN